MIIFDLICEPHHHPFEGWFASSDDYEAQLQNGLLCCPTCGSTEVRKVPSASHVVTRGETSRQGSTVGALPVPVPEEALRQFWAHLRQDSVDVGRQFAEEARKIHYQESPLRSIRGQASHAEVRELLDEGIPVLPLPGKPETH